MSGRKMIGIGIGFTVFVLIALIATVSILTKPGKAATVPRTVSSPTERYQGSLLTLYDGSMVVRYAGIPFAEPPVGDLRFRPPQPIRRNSSDILIKAHNFKKSCWSINKKITSKYYDEDCLYLNVYVPNGGHDTMRYPVVVWIHGGGFVAGSIFPEPSRFVARGEVIVVTFNFRLGVFGFMTTEDELLPANNGLWDQVMALRWVNENIEYFGGDPNSITLFGESAGASSAALHALSPVSSHLFHRVIMQSGSASSFLSKNPSKLAEKFGQNAGCNYTLININEFASCIRNLSVATILEQSKSVALPGAGQQVDFIWTPSVDQQLIPGHPSKLLNNETYLASINAYAKDYLFGLNNNDGSIFTNNFMHPLDNNSTLDVNLFKNLTNSLLFLQYGTDDQFVLGNISDTIVSFYTQYQTHDLVRKQTWMDLTADALFYAPTLLMAKAVSGCFSDTSSHVCDANSSQISPTPDCVQCSGRSYVYFFDFCPPSDDCEPSSCMTHGLQVSYQFQKKEFKDSVNQNLANYFVDFLSRFVKTEQPNLGLRSRCWPSFERNHQRYINLSPFSSVKQHLYPYRMDLWLTAIPKLLEEIDFQLE